MQRQNSNNNKSPPQYPVVAFPFIFITIQKSYVFREIYLFIKIESNLYFRERERGEEKQLSKERINEINEGDGDNFMKKERQKII